MLSCAFWFVVCPPLFQPPRLVSVGNHSTVAQAIYVLLLAYMCVTFCFPNCAYGHPCFDVLLWNITPHICLLLALSRKVLWHFFLCRASPPDDGWACCISGALLGCFVRLRNSTEESSCALPVIVSW